MDVERGEENDSAEKSGRRAAVNRKEINYVYFAHFVHTLAQVACFAFGCACGTGTYGMDLERELNFRKENMIECV